MIEEGEIEDGEVPEEEGELRYRYCTTQRNTLFREEIQKNPTTENQEKKRDLNMNEKFGGSNGTYRL